MVAKTRREISWRIYLVAFVLTLVIFGIGVYLGGQLQKKAISELIAEIDELKQKISATETLLLFEEGFCEIFVEEVGKFHAETHEIGKKIEHMERITVDPELKARYMLLELRDYVFVTKLNEKCAQNYSTILYFLNSENCSVCWEQGEELTKVRGLVRKEIFVYSFDAAVESSVVAALSKKFDVKVYPTLIINGRKYEGLTKANEVLSALGE